MYVQGLIVVFIILTLAISFIYFYMFARSQERFIRYWGLCWISYSISLLLLVLYINSDYVILLEIRKIFDLANILFLLFGAYAFMHIEIPSFWHRFGLYVTIWLIFGVYAGFNLAGIYLPISIYQVIATTMLCYIVYRYWQVPVTEKILSAGVFLLWGVGKAIMSMFEAYYYNISSMYLLEIILSNVLNFCIFIIYIQKTKEEVGVAERLYRIIAENANDAIFYYRLEPKPSFKYLSPSIENLTGYSPGEFYQNPKFYLNLVDSNEFENIKKVFRGEAEENTGLIMKAVHKSGTKFWAEVKNSVIYENGIIAAIEGTLRDVTALKEAELEQLHSKQSRDMLLSSISHELKTPITSIVGYVNALNDGTLKTQEEKEYATRVISSKAETLERLIDDLTQLSKLETRQFSFDFMLLSAEELVKELISDYTFEIKTAKIRNEILCDFRQLSQYNVIADSKRIGQVFSNILYNAMKFTEKDGKITIKIEVNEKKNKIIVSISDTGTGILKEDIPFVFDRFFRAQTQPKEAESKGSGLGLTISKEIINGHGGEISVKSTIGKGSTFTFEIPIYYDELSEVKNGG